MNVKKAAVVAVLTSGLAVAGAGAAFAYGADTGGGAANSPGVVSGNTIQVPVNVPVNLCNTTVSVIGLLDPGFGTPCLNS